LQEINAEHQNHGGEIHAADGGNDFPQAAHHGLGDAIQKVAEFTHPLITIFITSKATSQLTITEAMTIHR
jgi:hypothetical protein